MDELAKAKELNANEGFLLKNLEKDCKLLRRQTRSTGEVFAYYISEDGTPTRVCLSTGIDSQFMCGGGGVGKESGLLLW